MKKMFVMIFIVICMAGFAGCKVEDGIVNDGENEIIVESNNQREENEAEEFDSKEETGEGEASSEIELQEPEVTPEPTPYNREVLTPEEEGALIEQYGFVPDGFDEDGVPYINLM